MSATIYQPSADFVKKAHIAGMDAYLKRCAKKPRAITKVIGAVWRKN